MDNKQRWIIIIQNSITALVLTLFCFCALVQFNLLPSIYDRIQLDFQLARPVPIMIMEAFFVIIAASMAIFWGYFLDKIDRKRIIRYAMVLWIIGTGGCLIAPTFPLFLIARIFTAIGLGIYMPAAYGILADIIPSKFWSTLYGFLAFVSAFSNGFGNFMSGFLSPLNIWGLGWRFSFMFLFILTLIVFFFLQLVNFPERGASSIEEINKEAGKQLRERQLIYPFRIKKEDLGPLWRINSNRWLMYACFFAVIPGAAMGYFLVYYMVNVPFSSFPDGIRTQIASIFSGMIALGYFVGVFCMGPVVDFFSRKYPNFRTKSTFFGLLIATPLLFLSFFLITPVDFSTLGLNIDGNNPEFNIPKFILIVTAIFDNYPEYIAFFFVSFIGSLFASPQTINRTPVLFKVNLPEHQGSSQAILNFSDQLGKGVTLIILAFNYLMIEFLITEFNLLYVLMVTVLFYIPPAIWWGKIVKEYPQDHNKKNQVLEQRTKEFTKSKN
jgi:MFS family permease